MPFFHKIHCRYTGVKGFITTYQDGVRWQYMITKKAQHKFPEALNDKKTTPKTKRKRIWPFETRQEIKRIRQEHPNLGPEKIYPLLLEFCKKEKLTCPKPRTITRIIADDPEKMR